MMSVKKLIEREVAAAENASDDPNAPLPSHIRVTRGHDRTRVLQIRLSDDEYQAVLDQADSEHVPASTFARDILLRGIAS